MGARTGTAAREITSYRDEIKKGIIKRNWADLLVNLGRLQGFLKAIEDSLEEEDKKLIYPEIDRLINCAVRKDKVKCMVYYTNLDAALVSELHIPPNFKL